MGGWTIVASDGRTTSDVRARMDCECLALCPFFAGRMKNMPTTAELLKQQFCRGDWHSCARCTIVKALGRDAVPADLFPDDMERARRVLRAAGIEPPS
jgi:hypothetical protein